MPDKFLESISLERILPCLAEPGRVIVIGKPDRLLEPVIPYLASLPGVIAYNPDTSVLTFRRQPGFLTVFPEKITITQVKDDQEGLELLAAFREAVNAVWERRDELRPVTARRASARPLEVWALLPQTNCAGCGEATCLAFAVALIQGKRDLKECLTLLGDSLFANQRATLENLL